MTRFTADLEWAHSLGFTTSYDLGGEGAPQWVAEVDEAAAAIVDLIRIPDPGRSMMTTQSDWPESISAAAQRAVIADFVRHRRVLDDPETPMTRLIVVTDSERAVPMIAAAFTEAGLDGRAIVELRPR